MAQGGFSLQEFARTANAGQLRIPPREAWRWFNVNTPTDLEQARGIARERAGRGTKRHLSARGKAVSSAHDAP
jgi:NDP-sugar pyrophosphorylase family protein